MLFDMPRTEGREVALGGPRACAAKTFADEQQQNLLRGREGLGFREADQGSEFKVAFYSISVV
jgi:hypothetical protein